MSYIGKRQSRRRSARTFTDICYSKCLSNIFMANEEEFKSLSLTYVNLSREDMATQSMRVQRKRKLVLTTASKTYLIVCSCPQVSLITSQPHFIIC